jgi:hypothetical protein
MSLCSIPVARCPIPAVLFALLPFAGASGQVLQFGDQDVLGTGLYPTDPTAGSTLLGLAPGVVTFGAPAQFHGFPFGPGAGEFSGTDQIDAGSVQTAQHDGYSGVEGRLNGPMVLTFDYSSLVPANQVVSSLTLGIAFDDFQAPIFGQPFVVLVNGLPYAPLNTLVNSLDQSGPVVQFASIGLDPLLLLPDHQLTISIDLLGDGGDGFAVDFATVGIQTIPSPAAGTLLSLMVVGALRRRR